jgi:hypothetical protein
MHCRAPHLRASKARLPAGTCCHHCRYCCCGSSSPQILQLPCGRGTLLCCPPAQCLCLPRQCCFCRLQFCQPLPLLLLLLLGAATGELLPGACCSCCSWGQRPCPYPRRNRPGPLLVLVLLMVLLLAWGGKAPGADRIPATTCCAQPSRRAACPCPCPSCCSEDPQLRQLLLLLRQLRAQRCCLPTC